MDAEGVVVMDKWALEIAEAMGMTYSEVEEEIDRVAEDQAFAMLEPFMRIVVSDGRSTYFYDGLNFSPMENSSHA